MDENALQGLRWPHNANTWYAIFMAVCIGVSGHKSGPLVVSAARGRQRGLDAGDATAIHAQKGSRPSAVNA